MARLDVAFLIQFQSTRPRGRTRPGARRLLPLECVSIHASSREDATKPPEVTPDISLFQSTRPRGRTRQCSEAWYYL